jgi:hypothetical protein
VQKEFRALFEAQIPVAEIPYSANLLNFIVFLFQKFVKEIVWYV